jgi:mmgE/prpD family protein
MNQSIEFLKAIDELQNKKIPEEVLARAKQSLLDYVAVCSAGAVFQKEKIDNYMAFAMPEAGDFNVIGTGKRLSLKETVFLNGLNSHALDFDDGTNSGIIHLGTPIFSLLLPLAERYDLGVEEVLKAAVIGYETSYTMAVSIQPEHKAKGYHATGTCGVLGAAIAASYMLGFTEEERFQAFAVACVSASGMLKVLDDESELKPYNVAKTALLALTSIQLAKSGFKGHHDPLSGRGFIKMMTGKDEVELKPVLLNGTYAIMKTYTKPYASCRYTHPSVEAAIHLRERVRTEDINRVDVKTYSLAVAGHEHTDIPGSYSAKMSIPYATATGFIYGKAGLQEFSEECVKREEILNLTKKIHVESDEELSAMFPGVQAAIVHVTKTDGSVLTERVDFPKGEPENPLNEAEFKDRYDSLMAYARQAHGNEVYQLVNTDGTKVRKVMKIIKEDIK